MQGAPLVHLRIRRLALLAGAGWGLAALAVLAGAGWGLAELKPLPHAAKMQPVDHSLDMGFFWYTPGCKSVYARVYAEPSQSWAPSGDVPGPSRGPPGRPRAREGVKSGYTPRYTPYIYIYIVGSYFFLYFPLGYTPRCTPCIYTHRMA